MGKKENRGEEKKLAHFPYCLFIDCFKLKEMDGSDGTLLKTYFRGSLGIIRQIKTHKVIKTGYISDRQAILKSTEQYYFAEVTLCHKFLDTIEKQKIRQF